MVRVVESITVEAAAFPTLSSALSDWGLSPVAGAYRLGVWHPALRGFGPLPEGALSVQDAERLTDHLRARLADAGDGAA